MRRNRDLAAAVIGRYRRRDPPAAVSTVRQRSRHALVSRRAGQPAISFEAVAGPTRLTRHPSEPP